MKLYAFETPSDIDGEMVWEVFSDLHPANMPVATVSSKSLKFFVEDAIRQGDIVWTYSFDEWFTDQESSLV